METIPPRTTKKTIALDFDGVIHDYTDGWRNGEIYGAATPGAFETIEALLERGYAVFIHSSRDPQHIQSWLPTQKGWRFATEIILPDRRFWDVPNVVGITDRKVPAAIYVDDRAHKFDTSAQAAEHCWGELLELFL